MNILKCRTFVVMITLSYIAQVASVKKGKGGAALALNKQLFMPNFTKFCMLPNFLHVVLQEIPYFSTNMDQNGGGVG